MARNVIWTDAHPKCQDTIFSFFGALDGHPYALQAYCVYSKIIVTHAKLNNSKQQLCSDATIMTKHDQIWTDFDQTSPTNKAKIAKQINIVILLLCLFENRSELRRAKRAGARESSGA